MQLQVAGRRGVYLLGEACASPIRHAPNRWGGRLFQPGCMGLGLNESKSWVLANGLGFKWARLRFEYFLGLNLRFWISRIHSEEVSGSLAFGTRIFSSSGFRYGPQTESVYSFSPLIFQKTAFMHSKFSKNQHATKHTHTTYKKNNIPDSYLPLGL